MISIKECSPNWESALKKHVDFIQPRIEARIDFYLKLVACIKHGRDNTLDTSQFLTYLKNEFELNDSGTHKSFKSKANKLFKKKKKENFVLKRKEDYFLLLNHIRLQDSLSDLDRVEKLLHEIKSDIKKILEVEITSPYKSDFRVLKINNHLFSDIVFLFDEIFNYSDFSSLNHKEIWGPYQLLKELEINVCPYCNIHFTHTVFDDENTVVRPDLDHFLTKSDDTNKYLQVSFFNLIPSCLPCNQRIKNRAKICYTKHLNPYEKNAKHKLMRFDYNPTSLSGAKGDSEDLNIKIICDSVDPVLKTKTEGNVKLFRLVENYQMHKDRVQELVKRKEVWDAQHISLSKNTYTDFRMTKEEAYRQLFGNYYDEKDFARRPLSKLTKDIAEKLGLLK